MGTATNGSNRLRRLFGQFQHTGCPNVGYSYYLDTSNLGAGPHTTTATATNSDATPLSNSGAVTVTE